MNRYLPLSLWCWWLLVGASVLAFWPGCGDRQAEHRGEELFQQNCATCHEAPNPELKKQPPKLEGLFQSKTLPSGALATDEQVRKTIIKGVGTMPAFDQRLSTEDVNDLLAYLHQLK
ncbi:MAG TPA: cytochrome c [Terriglobia bacterium]|nr:cytochrome c [Terriglobia bacterium]